MKAAALRGALSDRAAHGRVHVVSRFIDGDEPRTKDALTVLSAACGAPPSAAPVLVVAAAGDVTTWKSLRNVPGVHLIAAGQLNTYDVLVSDHVVFTESALAQFVGRTGAGPAVDAPAADAEPAAAEVAGTEPAEAEETEAEETEATEPEDDES
jgi:large subunit ribosomal protein L4